MLEVRRNSKLFTMYQTPHNLAMGMYASVKNIESLHRDAKFLMELGD